MSSARDRSRAFRREISAGISHFSGLAAFSNRTSSDIFSCHHTLHSLKKQLSSNNIECVSSRKTFTTMLSSPSLRPCLFLSNIANLSLEELSSCSRRKRTAPCARRLRLARIARAMASSRNRSAAVGAPKGVAVCGTCTGAGSVGTGAAFPFGLAAALSIACK